MGFRWLKRDMLGKFRPREAVFFPDMIQPNALCNPKPSGIRAAWPPLTGQRRHRAETCSSKQLVLHATIKNVQEKKIKSFIP